MVHTRHPFLVSKGGQRTASECFSLFYIFKTPSFPSKTRVFKNSVLFPKTRVFKTPSFPSKNPSFQKLRPFPKNPCFQNSVLFIKGRSFHSIVLTQNSVFYQKFRAFFQKFRGFSKIPCFFKTSVFLKIPRSKPRPFITRTGFSLKFIFQ